MARFIDLDEIAPPDVTVKVGDVRYKLPGDIPVPDYLELTRLWTEFLQEDDDEIVKELFEDLSDRLLALFQVRQPDLDGLPVGPRTIIPLVISYLNGPEDADPEDEADVVPPTRRAGTRTKPSGGPRSKTTTPARRKTARGS